MPAAAIEFRDSVEGLAQRIRELDGPGLILLKSAHGAGLRRVADELTEGLDGDPGGEDGPC
jgi:hypothetical protein